ncbi:MAG: filamentous hemagglutinin N-terminal domain-containing protein [Cyanobacteria bacterium SID2]|nr:filamentous hemagglutinin N-terminal domain-containing protein [Cyanobacteria bacterium SID2]MBP0004237.1 filamentous hemagglutinin N-terminal domain-containing protein [Cyanobacteria bacterium SBC]
MASFHRDLFAGVGCAIFIWSAIDTSIANAQIVPDDTLGSRVEDLDGIRQVTGGTEVGTNLFHSFQEFNINLGETVRFENVSTIENIITRVTGDNISNINGVLGANGSANLFLLNPNGIVFGANARLEIGGSFLASTARTLTFENHESFDTRDSKPLLSINTPLGVQLDTNSGDIVHSSASLSVPTGQSLTLAGRNLWFDGGQLEAPEGRVALVAGSGRWQWNDRSLESNAMGGSIELTDNTLVNASGNGGGEVIAIGDRLSLDRGARILAETLGSGNGIGIEIAVDRLETRGNSWLSTTTYGTGAGGDFRIEAKTIDLAGAGGLQDVLERLFALERLENPSDFGSGLFAMTFGAGEAGTISIETDTLALRDSAFISTSTSGSGRGGLLEVQASDTVYISGAQIAAETLSDGDAGSVNFRTRNLQLDEGGGIFASTFKGGDGGVVRVYASDTIEIAGTTPNGQFNSAIAANAFSEATTQAGTIDVNARQIFIRDGAGIGAVTFGVAQGGIVCLNASESIELSGVRAEPLIRANINTRSVGTGAAGDITISTGRLVVRDGAEITTSTSNRGTAGRLTIRASEGIEIRGTDSTGQVLSRIRSDATTIAPFAPVSSWSGLEGVLGAAGDITIIAPELQLDNGGTLIVSSLGEGVRAGNVNIQVDRLILEDGAQVVAESEFAREGNIKIAAETIELRDNSSISTSASGLEPGGNLEIETNTLVALGNSDIIANAVNNQGGRISIRAQGIFGTEFRESLTSNSDITASSELGADFEGSVEIDRPNLDTTSGLVGLSQETTDVAGLVTDRCSAWRAGSDFSITGRGGLPPNPYEPTIVHVLWQDLRSIDRSSQPDENREPMLVEPIVEATGWQQNEDGTISLVSPQAANLQTFVDRSCP